MDPNANLREQREIIERCLFGDDDSGSEAERLYELVEAMDEWLSSGGALPKDWRTNR